jgi:hypothetical protein
VVFEVVEEVVTPAVSSFLKIILKFSESGSMAPWNQVGHVSMVLMVQWGCSVMGGCTCRTEVEWCCSAGIERFFIVNHDEVSLLLLL